MSDLDKSNRISGSEQMTRPEEVGALSKYLGEIRKVQEAHTKLGEDNLEVFGRATGKIPEINSLSEYIEDIENQNKDTDLSTVVERIKEKPNNDLELSDFLDTPERASNEIKELDGNVVSLKKDSLDLTLSDRLETINSHDIVESLPTESVNIDINNNVNLDTNLEKLTSASNPEIVKLNESVLATPESKASEVVGLNDSILAAPESKNDLSLEELPSTNEYLINAIDNANKTLNDTELLNFAMELLDYDNSEWSNKLAVLMSTYLTGPVITPERAQEFEYKLTELAKTSSYVKLANVINEQSLVQESQKLDFGVDKKVVLSNNKEILVDVDETVELEDRDIEKLDNSAALENLNEDVVSLNNTEKVTSLDNTRVGSVSELRQIDALENEDTVTQIDRGNFEMRRLPNTRVDSISSVRSNDPTIERIKMAPFKRPELKEFKQLFKISLYDYIRDLAENKLGKTYDWVKGNILQNENGGSKTRANLVNEALAVLVLGRELTEIAFSRHRLPGHRFSKDTAGITNIGAGILSSGSFKNTISSKLGPRTLTTAVNLAKSVTKTAAGVVDKTQPINRPHTEVKVKFKNLQGESSKGSKNLLINGVGSVVDIDKGETKSFQIGNNRNNITRSNNDTIDKIIEVQKTNYYDGSERSSSTGYNFVDNYLLGEGMRITLEELCDTSEKPSSVESLAELLKNSPYITTPKKFGTISRGEYGTQTLDSNAYWEVIIEPFVCDSGTCSNGGKSFLPAFSEINTKNALEFGVRTRYNKWVPVNSFELQKTRLVTKSLGLFDGEINYPTSIEFTNELRLTIVDDQYKSWLHYFQTVSDVSVYNSRPHNKDYYKNLDCLPTAVDKSSICIANYKNLAFEIKIYIMTPQYATIRKYDLLCVLKEFSEDYRGEIDSGGTDLNVLFSIVGENPGLTNTSSEIASMLQQIPTKTKPTKEDKDKTETIPTLKKLGPGIRTVTVFDLDGVPGPRGIWNN